MDEWLQLFLSEEVLTPAAGETLTEEQALRLALREGFRGYGFTSPNPAVGCVILDHENKFLASGYHAKVGEPHAEIIALSGIGPSPLVRNNGEWDLTKIPIEKLRGAKAFVTLEPCAHEGRTPSCAKTLARLPLKKVTCILRDPNPLVSGEGLAVLKRVGFEVRCIEDEGPVEDTWTEAARALCEFFLVNVHDRRTFVSLKVATSLDGMLGLKTGESQWLTSERSRLLARFLRGAHEACLVGKNTILQDNPRLDARETPFEGLSRKLIILDSAGEILKKPELAIFQNRKPQDILVFVKTGAGPSQSPIAQVFELSERQPHEFLSKALGECWAQKIGSVWIEGGAQTLSSALEAGIGDRLWLFQGPHLLGGLSGRPWTESWGIAQMKHRKSLVGVRHLGLGGDHLTTGRVQG